MCLALPLAAQPNTDKVGKLVAAENYFAALVKEKGIKKAFLSVADAQALIFRPGPQSVARYYENAPESTDQLSWEPVFARVSKSDDWGFTTGPYTFKASDTSTTTSYGEYVSVWKKNKRGVWKLALDAGVSHPRPTRAPELEFLNPAGDRFIRQFGSARLQQREDIVLSSDQLFATILKADNKIAHKEFLTDETRLLFPGFPPMKGKAAVSAFWEKQGMQLSSQPVAADRSLSGELAFTYGDATISSNGKTKTYHYVRIWEIQPEFKWGVILEIYVPIGAKS